MEIRPEATDCPQLMRAVLEVFRISSSESGVELRCRADEMPLLMLDPQRLRQIVFNLVGNAVKFPEKGYVELCARFERPKGADTGMLRLEVEDTGCGISEEDLKRIGSAYAQVGANSSRNGGTGLGLAICKQLAAAMGGSLEVDSTLGVGSMFSVVIPNVKIAPDRAGAINCAPPVPTVGGSSFSSTEGTARQRMRKKPSPSLGNVALPEGGGWCLVPSA